MGGSGEAEQQIASVMDDLLYGLYIVGSKSGADANGMMADWVMQVSFEPRLVAVSLDNDAHTLQNIRNARMFTVNLLPADAGNMQLAAMFAEPYRGSKVEGRAGEARMKVHHKLEGIPHTETEHGCPVLESATGWLECRAEQFVPVGDHTLVIGRVIDGRRLRQANLLTSLFVGWTYSA